MNLFDAAERLAAIDRSRVILDSKGCLHAHDQSSNCTACVDICPVSAFTLLPPPVLNDQSCQSCLACLPVCPVGAIHADDDVSSLLNCATHVEDKSVELICGLHPQPASGAQAEDVAIRIQGCLAGLGAGAYLSLVALGLEHISLRTDACKTCKWSSLEVQVEHQSRQANQFLADWNHTDGVACLSQVAQPVERSVLDAKNPPLSRRDLFRMLGRQGQVAMARAMENGARGSERQPGRDRLRILSALAHLPEAASPVNLDSFGFASLQVSEDCTACGVCSKACPTQAIRFEKNEDDTSFSLLFTAQKCIACDICATLCIPDAIRIEKAPSFDQIFGADESLVVASGALVHCDKCETLMAAQPGVRFCTLCEHRRSHPFGSVMPAELKSQLKNSRKGSKS